MRTVNNSMGKSSNQELYCPVTNQPVVSNEWKKLAIPGGQAAWGHCPACWGWHVVLGPEVEPRLALAAQEVFSLAI
jgi:hypothetical protein